MFTVRDTVAGNGFLGAVTLSGRAVIFLDNEDGRWWVYGVRPGAIAETGTTPEEAFLRFRNTYKNLLFDFAAEAAHYEAFREAVESFYYQKDQEEENRWQSAFMAIRTGDVKPDERFLANLPKEAPETRPTGIVVERLDAQNARYNPTDNVPDYCSFALPVAA